MEIIENVEVSLIEVDELQEELDACACFCGISSGSGAGTGKDVKKQIMP